MAVFLGIKQVNIQLTNHLLLVLIFLATWCGAYHRYH